MNRKPILVFACFLVLVAGTGAVLARVRTNYTLGKPGVKLGNTPIYTDKGQFVANISVDLPATIANCSSVPATVDPHELQVLPPDTTYGRRLYTDSHGLPMFVTVVLMGTDRTSIHKPQYCLPGQGFKIEQTEVATIPISRPYAYDLKVMKLRVSSERRMRDGTTRRAGGVFVYWFVADGHLTPHHVQRMWWMGRDLLTKGLLQRWAYVGCLAECPPGQEEALFERMKNFIAEAVPEFQLATGEPKEKQAVSLSPAPKSGLARLTEFRISSLYQPDA